MRVLLFGGNGQVGSRLKELLGDDCIALTRAECDLSQLNEKQTRALIESHEPDIIINAAAFTKVDDAEKDDTTAILVNTTAPGILARAAGSIPFIHFSTDYVFDGNAAPYTEDATCNPVNRYGQSKWRGEQEVLAAGGPSYIFRLQWVYDVRGANFMLTMQRLMRERGVLKVVADQFGAPTPAPSIAHAVAQALPLIIEGKLPTGIYHMASGGHTTWHGFACTIAQALDGSAAEVVEALVTPEYPTPAPRAYDTRLDCSALARHGIVLPHWRDAFLALMEAPDAHR